MKSAPLHRIAAALLAVSALLAPLSANAIFRAYVASDGLDTNPCTLPQPCRLLPAALTVVDSGGEIWMLDSANYNAAPVSITKSVTILAIPGAVGSIVATGGDGLVVNNAGIKVVLRNLAFVNLSGGLSGVQFTTGSSLTIRDSSFIGLPLAGVNVTNLGSKTQITNTTFTNNNIGLRVIFGRATIAHSEFTGNAIAIQAGGAGGANQNPPNGSTMVRITHSQVLDNTTAFHMDSTSTRRDGQCNGSNIYLYHGTAGPTNHIVGNGTYVNVTGGSDLNTGCTPGQFTIDTYSSPAS